MHSPDTLYHHPALRDAHSYFSPAPFSSTRPTPTPSIGHSALHHRRQSKVGMNMVISPEEYESLPLSIQKKYFSSVERLRIVQQAASQKRKKRPATKDLSWISPKSSIETARPKTAHSYRTVTSFSQPRYLSAIRPEADVSEDQALKFLALPEKVKRSHFTPEELMLLTESSERALSVPTIHESYIQRLPVDRNGSVGSSYYHSLVSGDLDELEEDWCELETKSARNSEPSSHGSEILRMYAGRRSGSVSSAYSSNQPHSIKEAARPESRRSWQSRKKTSLLAPLPLPPPTLLPAVPPLPSPGKLQTLSSIRTPEPLSPSADVPMEPNYYKDSQARSKLREFLISPEKFDEALEFGFPTDCIRGSRSRSITSDEDVIYAEMEELSATNSRYDDEDSSNCSPTTPSGFSDADETVMAPYSSVNSGVPLSMGITQAKAIPRSLSPDLSGREMTLRMTLTRHDLRAPEQELYAFQRQEVSGVEVETKDPLALEALRICEDHSGAQGAFAVTRTSKVGGGGLKKVWKSLCTR